MMFLVGLFVGIVVGVCAVLLALWSGGHAVRLPW